MRTKFTLVYFLLQIVESYFYNGYMAQDLELQSLVPDIANWTFQTSSGTLVTSCQGELLFGGYATFSPGDFVERTYVTAVTHSIVYLKFSLWRIDSWDAPDALILSVDGGSQTFSFSGMNVNSFANNFCGSSDWKDSGEVVIFIIFQHTAPTLTLRFINGLDEGNTNEAFGINKLSYNLYNITDDAPSMPYARCLGPYTPSQCQETLLSTFNLIAPYSCHPNCNYCVGPFIEDCLDCIDDTTFFSGDPGCIECPWECINCVNETLCITPTCNDHNLYAFWDTVCNSQCEFPLQVRNITTYPACVYPCDPSEYLYWDGTCSSSCPSPYTISVKSERYFCNSDCPPGTFLYPNSTCLASCDPPMIQEVSGNFTLCKSYCSATDFLYEDGTCQPTCESPPYIIVNQSGSLYCNKPCPGKITMWDGSCYTKCDPPTILITNSTGKFCIYQCQTVQFLNTNGSCEPICNPPLKTRVFKSRQFCDYPCPSGSYLFSDGTCKKNCIAPMIPDNSSGQAYCNTPCPGQFLYSNGSCMPGCNSPYSKRTTGTIRYCDDPCPLGQYRYANDSCGSNCKYPYVNSTLNGELRCDFVCGSNFLLPNNSCSSSCPSLLITNTSKICSSPCLPNQILFFNSSCTSFCPPIFQLGMESGVRTCTSECAAPRNYIAPDGSCSKGCISPLISAPTGAGLYFCKPPCPPGKYVDINFNCLDECLPPNTATVLFGVRLCGQYCPNGTILNTVTKKCVSNCPDNTKMITPKGYPMCEFACKAKTFLFPNGSCMTDCKSPWVSSGDLFLACDPPCPNGTIYYPVNKTCISNCTSPFIVLVINEINTCYLFCKDPFISFNGSCICRGGYKLSSDGNVCEPKEPIISSKAAVYFKNIMASAAGVFLIGGANPAVLWGVIHLMQVFYYLVFMNVDYPVSVLNFLSLFDLRIIPNFLGKMLGESAQNAPDLSGGLTQVVTKKVYVKNSNDLYSPEKFYENKYSGYFVNTAGDFLQIIIIMLLAYVIFKLIHHFVKDKIRGTLKKIFVNANFALEWSLFIRIYFTGYTRLNIAALLQILVFDVSSFKFALSFILSAITLCFNLYLLLVSPYLISQTKINKTKYLKYESLVDDFKSKNYCDYTMTFLFIQRMVLAFALVIFYDVPFIQNAIPWANYLQMTAYYLFKWPHKDFLANLDGLSFQLGLFIIHTIIFYFCSVDIDLLKKDSVLHERLGVIIILTCLIVLVVRAFVMISLIIMPICIALKNAYENKPDRKKRKLERGYSRYQFNIGERRNAIVHKSKRLSLGNYGSKKT